MGREGSLQVEATKPSTVAERERIIRVYAARGEGDYGFADLWSLQLAHQRQFQLARLLKSVGMCSLTGRRVLEVGCGDGRWLRLFNHWGAEPENLYGCDINPRRLTTARGLHPTIHFDETAGDSLDYADGSFDVVLQSTVFSSILDGEIRQRLAAEMVRVIRPGGAILWFDFRYNNPRNRAVRGISRGEIHQLFPGCRVRLRSLGLLPPLARRLVPWSPLLAAVCERVPPLRYAYLGLIQRRA